MNIITQVQVYRIKIQVPERERGGGRGNSFHDPSDPCLISPHNWLFLTWGPSSCCPLCLKGPLPPATPPLLASLTSTYEHTRSNLLRRPFLTPLYQSRPRLHKHPLCSSTPLFLSSVSALTSLCYNSMFLSTSPNRL